MVELRRRLRALMVRALAVEFCANALRCFFYALCILAAALLLHRLVHFSWLSTVGLACLIAVLPAAVASTLLSRTTLLKVAAQADERLHLHERVSSALLVAESGLPMVGPLLDDALERVRGVRSREAFPFRGPREARLLPLPIAGLLLLFFMPNLDLLARKSESDQQAAVQKDLEEQAKKLRQRAQELRKHVGAKLSPSEQALVEKINQVSREIAKAPTKKAAVAKLSKLSDDLEKRKRELSRLSKVTEALKNSRFGKGLTKTGELAKALKRGDFAAAAEALSKLRRELAEGELTPEQTAQLRAELQRLSRELEQAGELGRRLKSMADGLMNENLAEALKDLELAEAELRELDQLMREMELIELALNDIQFEKMDLMGWPCGRAGLCGRCGNKLCRGCGTPKCTCCPDWMKDEDGFCCRLVAGRCAGPGGCGLGFGNVPGGRGLGLRPIGPKEPTDFLNTKLKGKMTRGDILGAWFVRGLPPKKELRTQFANAVAASRKEAEEALAKEKIPLPYRALVRDYFDTIEPEEERPASDKE